MTFNLHIVITLSQESGGKGAFQQSFCRYWGTRSTHGVFTLSVIIWAKQSTVALAEEQAKKKMWVLHGWLEEVGLIQLVHGSQKSRQNFLWEKRTSFIFKGCMSFTYQSLPSETQMFSMLLNVCDTTRHSSPLPASMPLVDVTFS